MEDKEKYTKMLKDVYYKEGKPYGRDGLYFHLKTKFPKDHPDRNFVEEWLRNQELQQKFAPQRKGGSVDRFYHSRPWQQISSDLIDFTNRPAGPFRYILVVMDNFSRYLYLSAISSKEAKVVAKAFRKVMEIIKKEWGKTPSSVLVDDGGEYKGEFLKVLKDLRIRKIRTLGGTPQSNGLIERSNASTKMLLRKNKEINGGSWKDNLKATEEAYNDKYIRTIDTSPNVAVKYNTRKEQSMLRANVEKARREIPKRIRDAKTFELGDFVRVRLTKGKLSKQSDQSWSSRVYRIGRVIPARGTIATKYKIEGRDQDQSYSRNDLLRIDPDKVEKIPIKQKKPMKEIIENGRPVEVPAREKSTRRRQARITEMPDWRKGKIVWAKYPVKEGRKKVEQWFQGKVESRSDTKLSVRFDLDDIVKEYTLNDYRKGLLSETMPMDAPAVNNTPLPPQEAKRPTTPENRKRGDVGKTRRQLFP